MASKASRWRLISVAMMSVIGVSAFTPSSQRAHPAAASGGRWQRSRPALAAVIKSAGGDDDDAADELAAEIEAEARSVAAAVGGDSASVQFMITQRMRQRLVELGYSEAEVDALDPQQAAAIIQGSSKVPQQKAKSKRDRFEMRFTCNVCEGPNSHSISRHAYAKGTVIVTCPTCNSTHLIADNLNWIEDDFRNLEDFMAKRGTPVTRVVNDGVAASAAAHAAALLPELEDEPEDSDRATSKPIDGITDDQAARIREAVRAAKRKRRPQG